MGSPFDRLYAAFAVPPGYDGPLAREFHAMVARRYLAGMRGGRTTRWPWASDAGIVREHLSIDWQRRHWHTFPMANFDRPTLGDRFRHKVIAPICQRLFPDPFR